MSSPEGLKICAITTGFEECKRIIQKKEKKT